MKKSIIPVCLLGAISLVASCGNKNDSISSIEKERDSLLTVNYQQQMILDNMTSTMAEISMSLDSIAIQEQMIIRGVDELGNPLNKKNLKSKLTSLSEIIKNQREKMLQHLQGSSGIPSRQCFSCLCPLPFRENLCNGM